MKAPYIANLGQDDRPQSVTNAIHLNIPIWERKFTRDEIKAGYTITNEKDVTYLIVNTIQGLKIVCTDNYIVGPKVAEIMNEDMTPSNSDYAEIVEVKDKEGKVVYLKEI